LEKHSIKVAGVDVSKPKLDVAMDGVSEVFGVTNNKDGWENLAKRLKEHGVTRVLD
jgi:hypothetical protein